MHAGIQFLTDTHVTDIDFKKKEISMAGQPSVQYTKAPSLHRIHGEFVGSALSSALTHLLGIDTIHAVAAAIVCGSIGNFLHPYQGSQS